MAWKRKANLFETDFFCGLRAFRPEKLDIHGRLRALAPRMNQLPVLERGLIHDRAKHAIRLSNVEYTYFVRLPKAGFWFRYIADFKQEIESCHIDG